jgi:hypothetical protein
MWLGRERGKEIFSPWAFARHSIFYRRSKTGDQLSVRITDELRKILGFYLRDKTEYDYLFPANYDGSTKSYEKYKSLRRRMNGTLKSLPMMRV